MLERQCPWAGGQPGSLGGVRRDRDGFDARDDRPQGRRADCPRGGEHGLVVVGGIVVAFDPDRIGRTGVGEGNQARRGAHQDERNRKEGKLPLTYENSVDCIHERRYDPLKGLCWIRVY